MEALIELCDLVAQNPTQFADKLTWMCSRCPQPETLVSRSSRVTRSQLNAILAVSRFLSKSPPSSATADLHLRPKSIVLEFLRAVPSSFNQSFWPQSFSYDSIASFFSDYLSCVAGSSVLDPEFASEIMGVAGGVMIVAIEDNVGDDPHVSRAFLLALTRNFLPLLPSDAEKLMTCLLERLSTLSVHVPVPASPSDRHIGLNSETSSTQSSPLTVKTNNVDRGNYNNEISSPTNDLSPLSVVSTTSVVVNGSGMTWKSSTTESGTGSGLNDGGGSGSSGGMSARQQVASFEEESVEELEKQEIAFKLIGHVLEHARVDTKILEQVRCIAKDQLKSLSAFLKVLSTLYLLAVYT